MAWGRYELPCQISFNGYIYHRKKVFKHDFFAATLLFHRGEKSSSLLRCSRVIPVRSYFSPCVANTSAASEPPEWVILKLARRADFLGMPLMWLGQMLCNHECNMLKTLRSVPGTPQLLGTCGPVGLLYEYIEGHSLDELYSRYNDQRNKSTSLSAKIASKNILPSEFFIRLEQLLKDLHSLNIAYIDMNKRGNILIGSNNKPFLIDFQISCKFPQPRGPLTRLLRRCIFNMLINQDYYHLLKHKRHFCRAMMTEQEIQIYRRKNIWIRLHRFIFRPLTRLRRNFLFYLYNKGCLLDKHTDHSLSENNPARWAR